MAKTASGSGAATSQAIAKQAQKILADYLKEHERIIKEAQGLFSQLIKQSEQVKIANLRKKIKNI